jgi:hypothetical protein
MNVRKDATATDELIDRASEVTRKIRIELFGTQPLATILRETMTSACD